MKRFLVVVVLVILLIFSLVNLQRQHQFKEIKIVEKEVVVDTQNTEAGELSVSFIIEPVQTILKYTNCSANIRTLPLINSSIVTTVPINTKIEKVETIGEWIKIKYNRQFLYVYKNLLSDTETIIPEPEPVIEQPKSNKIYLGKFKITAYCACRGCSEGWGTQTTSGVKAKAGVTIAADRRFPFGTKLEIDGHEYIVQDRGGAIKGNRIDIFFDNHRAATSFGVKSLDVYQINQ